MLPTVAFLGAIITSIVWVFTYGRTLGIRAGIPLVVCLSCGVLTALVAPVLLDAGFTRVLPRYAAIIQQMEAGRIAVPPKPTRITLPEPDNKLAYAIWAEKATDGVLTVTFFVGGSFPVKHWGYLYCSAGEIASGSSYDSQWPKRRQLRDKWFYISD